MLLLSLYLWGNAEPIDIKSSLKSTGNLVTLQKSNIEIKSEKLNITINDVTADIEVNYTYINKGKDDTIFFAFPVDFEMDMFDSRNDPTHYDIEIFKIKVNGKETKYDHIVEKGYTCSDRDCNSYVPLLSTNLLYERDGVIIRRWHIAKIEFLKQKRTNISISYRVRAFGDPNIYSGNPVPRMDTRKIFYDFSPAQYFGMGKSDKMEIVIDVRKWNQLVEKLRKLRLLFLRKSQKECTNIPVEVLILRRILICLSYMM